MGFGGGLQILARLATIALCGCAATNETATSTGTGDFVEVSLQSSPEAKPNRSYHYVITRGGDVLENGDRIARGKRRLFSAIEKSLAQHHFHAITGDYTMATGHCKSYALDDGDYYLSAHIGSAQKAIRWDLGCEGFQAEDRLTALMLDLDRLIKRAHLKGK